MTTLGKAVSDPTETQCTESGERVPQRNRGPDTRNDARQQTHKLSPTRPLIWRLLEELDEKGI